MIVKMYHFVCEGSLPQAGARGLGGAVCRACPLVVLVGGVRERALAVWTPR
jgi:hypothetical protein